MRRLQAHRFFSLLMLLAVSAGCHTVTVEPLNAPIPESAATRPVERPDDYGKKRTAVTFENSKKDGPRAKVVFIGDSITEGWEGSGKPVWDKLFADWQAINLGVGGDQTQHVLWRLQNGQLDPLNPNVIVLLIGINNRGSSSTPQQTADGTRAIVTMLHGRLPRTHVIVMKVFPAGEEANTDTRKMIDEINRLTERQIVMPNVEFLDIGPQLVQPDGRISKDIMPDFLHLSEQGYEIWGAALKPRVEKYLD